MQATKMREWSQRSQRSLLEENDLRLKLAERQAADRTTERQIAELESLKAGQLKRSLEREGGFATSALSRTLQELEEKNRLLVAYQEQRRFLESELRDLTDADSAEQKARAEQQARVAELAGSRLEKDQKIGAAGEALRQLLQDRAALTARLVEAASAVELDFDADEAQRFDGLLASLPTDFAGESEAWMARFLGEPTNTKPYVVRDECLVVPEILAHNGVYYLGDAIELTDAEARELMRLDRPANSHGAPWRCLPPSVTTIEAHEAAVEAAEEKGISVRAFYLFEDIERDRDHERRFHNGQPIGGAPASSRFSSPRILRMDAIRLKAKTRISCGRDYEPGEVLEVDAEDALSLLRSGAAEPVFS